MKYIKKSKTLTGLIAVITIFISFELIIITFNNRRQDQQNNLSLDRCEQLHSISAKLSCWEDLVDSVLKQNGIQQAFALIDKLYNTDPQFVPECHTFVHIIGAKAYDLFSNGTSFNLPPQTTFCGYGFYHGFTETLVSKRGSATQAKSFCSFVEQKLGNQLPDIENQCYHGFGHGSVDIHNENIWGDEIKMISPAIKICNEVTDNSSKLFRCGTGIFDSISIAYFTNQYKLAMNKEDPFWLCREQKQEEFKKACYVSMDSALFSMTNFDFVRASKFIEQIPEDDYATMAMASLALPVYWVEQRSDEKTANKIDSFYKEQGIEVCHSLQPRLRIPCIQAIAYGLTDDEASKPRYREGISFCRNSMLSEEERNTCLGTLWATIKVVYTKEKVSQICNTEGDNNDKKFCSV